MEGREEAGRLLTLPLSDGEPGVVYTITTPGSESPPIQQPSATANSVRINHKNEQSKGNNSLRILPQKKHLKKAPNPFGHILDTPAVSATTKEL